MTALPATDRIARLRWIVAAAGVVLLVKVLLGILAEYWWYFPADFEQSAFLSGRRHSFGGWYAAAFYVHILCGPPAVLLSLWMIASGGRPRLARWHRLAGKLLAAIVLVLVVPSGLFLARQAYAGPPAAAGFAALSLATGGCTAATAWLAATKRFRLHQRLAAWCFILLVSPLVLRLASGLAIVMEWESALFYQLNAWLSWLVPLAGYEICSRWIAAAAPAAATSGAGLSQGSVP